MTTDHRAISAAASASRIRSQSRRFRAVFYLHIVFNCIVVPILLPLRTFEVWNAAEVIYANVLIVALYAVAVPSPLVFVPTRFLQLLLLYCLVVGSLIGLSNLEDPRATRDYFSHVFQILSAYVMYSAGTSQSREIWNDRTMRLLMLAAIASEYLGSAAIYAYGFQFGLGGYLVGGGLAGFLALCYFLPRSSPASFAAFATVLLSGKRGELVAALVVVASHFTVPRMRLAAQRLSLTSLFAGAAVTLVAAFTIAWLNAGTASEVVDWLEYRVESIQVALVGGDEGARVAAAGGRYEETDALMSEFGGIDWVVGKGFGYQVSYSPNDELVEEIHQVHFTPATLTVRFGLPAATLMMGYFVVVVLRAWMWRRRARRRGDDTVRINQLQTTWLYVLGQLLVSLTAFLIFGDLFFMLFIGILDGWIAVEARRAATSANVRRFAGTAQ